MLAPQIASAQLAPTPRALDFGVIAVSCPTPRGFVGLENTGQTAIEVAGALIEGSPVVQVGPDFRLPLRLEPGARATLPIEMTATPIGPWQALLQLDTSAGPRTVSLFGEVRDRIEDRHITAPGEAVDLLLIIDDAASMREERASLAANVQALGQFLKAQAVDGRVAVTTTSYRQGGRFLALPDNGGTVLDVAAPSFEAGLSMLTAAVGAAGPQDHAGLWALQRALSEHNLAGPNAGFLRPGAVLSVILISDGPDLSPGSVDAYVTQLRAVRGFWRRNLVSLSAIVGDAHGGCRGPGGDALGAPRYIEVAERTGGVFQSVCTSDWSRSLEDLSTAAFGFKSVFRLSHPPIVSTLEVYDDLEFVPSTSRSGTLNWTYDDGPTRVSFSPFSAPEPSSQVEIDYRPRCQIATAIYAD